MVALDFPDAPTDGQDFGVWEWSDTVDAWRWNPENNVLACFRIFKRLSSNEAVPSMEMNRCKGL